MYNENLFNPYEGLLRGNLFKNLYQPYLNKVIEINPMTEKEKLSTNIYALNFSLIDLNLYLDVYPDDRNLINLFNNYKKELNILTNEYENKYGPLTLNSESNNNYPWAWNKMPWPWC